MPPPPVPRVSASAAERDDLADIPGVGRYGPVEGEVNPKALHQLGCRMLSRMVDPRGHASAVEDAVRLDAQGILEPIPCAPRHRDNRPAVLSAESFADMPANHPVAACHHNPRALEVHSRFPPSNGTFAVHHKSRVVLSACKMDGTASSIPRLASKPAARSFSFDTR